jgi:hypothetical protein
MRRRTSLLLGALVCLALTVASPASAQEPTIVTDIIFPEEGEPFGTFTATAPLCPSGTFVDEFVGGGGAFQSGLFYHGQTVLKTFTCADSSGTFTILFHPNLSPATPAGCEEAGPFAVVGGTGAYVRLRGHGDFCVVPVGGDRFTETFTGTFTLG